MKFGVATAVRDGCGTFRACALSVRASAAAARLAPEGAVHFVQESSSSARSVRDDAVAAGCDFASAPDRGIYDGIGRALDRAAAAGCDVLSWLNADEQYLPAAFGAAQRIFESNGRISIVFGDSLILGRGGRPRGVRVGLFIRTQPLHKSFIIQRIAPLLLPGAKALFAQRAHPGIHQRAKHVKLPQLPPANKPPRRAL